MKRTDMEKLAGRKIDSALERSGSPARFGTAAAGAALGRKERRKLDQAQGLVPFAVKIDAGLAAQVRALAQQRSQSVDDTLTELLRKALAD